MRPNQIQEFNETARGIAEGVENMASKVEGHDARLSDIEKKLIRRGGSGVSAGGYQESWGSRFLADADLRGLENSRGRASIEVRAALTTSTADADGSSGALVVPSRDRVVGMPQQRLTIRNLLQVTQVDGGSVEYAEQVGRTNNADVVAEGVTKNESSLQYELKQVPLRVIAHWMKASRQILSDAPQLRDAIDQELRYGLALVEEQELLFGSGTGQHLEGMVPQAAEFSDELGLTGANEIDTIGLAILQASLTDVPPDGIVLHPADWWRMRLTKDEEGHYILGKPMEVVTPSLFGLPVVLTPSMTADRFLVGSFGSQTLYDRWQARVEVGFEGTDFIDNLVTLLGEERIGFACKRPEALITGTFGNAAS